jgi:small conductance mechanosensitive channel
LDRTRIIVGVLSAIVLSASVLAAGASPASAAEPEAPADPAAAPAVEVDPLVEEGEALWAGRRARVEQVEALRRQLRGRTGEDLVVLEEKIWHNQLEGVALTREIAQNVLAREAQGLDAGEQRRKISEIFERGVDGFEEHFVWRDRRVADLRKQREALSGSERLSVERRLTAEQDRYQIALSEFGLTLDSMADLGLDVEAARKSLVSRLTQRADDLASRLEIDWRAREALRERLAGDPDSKDLQAELQGVDESFTRRERLLRATISQLERQGVGTASYKETLIRTTGELSTGIFDREVAAGLMRSATKALRTRIAERGPVWAIQVLLFAIILLLFWILAAVTRRLVRRLVRSERVEMSKLLRDTLIAWSSRVVFFVGLLVALSQVGIQIGPLLAGLGIAGFIVGFALQDSLANFAAGAMILIYRPYDVDDVIESGTVRGRVSHMSLVSTTILTFDNQTLIVPNNKIWGDVIRNVTAQSARRIDLVFRVGYEHDVQRVERLFYDVMAAHAKVLDDPAPAVKVNELGEFAVVFAVRPWVRREDYWDVYWDMTREVKLAFDREGIRPPRPQREVHVVDDAEVPTSPHD